MLSKHYTSKLDANIAIDDMGESLYFTDYHFIYLGLQLLMYILLGIGGIKLAHARNSKVYWLVSILPILAFGLNFGLRWGRGVDYNLYYWVYDNILHGLAVENAEPLWKLLVLIVGNIFNIPWAGMVLLMSFFLIFSLVFFIQNYREVAYFALPLFALNVVQSQNLMRWFLAFSFFLIALKYLEDRSVKYYFIFSICSFLIHFGFIIVIIPIYLLSFCKKVVLPPWASVSIFLSSYFLFNRDYMSVLASFVYKLNIGSRFALYQNNAEMWLTGDNLEMMGISTIGIINSIYIIILGYRMIQKRKNLIFMYNITLVGIVTAPAMAQIELMWRINLIFFLFQFIILSYLFYDYVSLKKSRNALICIITIVVLLLNIRTSVLQPLTAKKNSTYYIWDSHGRKVL